QVIIVAYVGIECLHGSRGRDGGENEVSPHDAIRAPLKMRHPALTCARPGDLLAQEADLARAGDGERGVGRVGDRQEVAPGGPCDVPVGGTPNMHSEEASGLSVSPREVHHAAVVRMDGDGDGAANALLSGGRGAVAHEGKAHTLYHALAGKAVTGRERRLLQI